MSPTADFLLRFIHLKRAATNTTQAERDCLALHAAGRRRLAEVGVFQGVSTCVLRRAMAPDGVLLAIDPFFKNRLGLCYYGITARRDVNRIRRGTVDWMEMTGGEAARHLTIHDPTPIDFLFMDGDHSWESTEADWLGFRPLLADGAVVAIHDSRNCGNCGSERFTNEVILRDEDFRLMKTVDALTIVERRGGGAVPSTLAAGDSGRDEYFGVQQLCS